MVQRLPAVLATLREQAAEAEAATASAGDGQEGASAGPADGVAAASDGAASTVTEVVAAAVKQAMPEATRGGDAEHAGSARPLHDALPALPPRLRHNTSQCVAFPRGQHLPWSNTPLIHISPIVPLSHPCADDAFSDGDDPEAGGGDAELAAAAQAAALPSDMQSLQQLLADLPW
jgi:hypothetical protein